MPHDQVSSVVAGLLSCDSCAIDSNYCSIASIPDDLNIQIFPVSIVHPFLNGDELLICESPIDAAAICYTSDNIISDLSSLIDIKTLSTVSDIAVKAASLFYYGATLYYCPYVSLLYAAQKILRDSGTLDPFCTGEENQLFGISACDILEYSSHAYLLYSANSAVKLLVEGYQYERYLKMSSSVLSKAFFSKEAISMPGVHTPVMTPYVLEKFGSELTKFALGTDVLESEFLGDFLSKATGKSFKYASEEVLVEGKRPTIDDLLKISFDSVKKGFVISGCHYFYDYGKNPLESQLNKYCNIFSNKASSELSKLSLLVFNQTV